MVQLCLHPLSLAQSLACLSFCFYASFCRTSIMSSSLHASSALGALVFLLLPFSFHPNRRRCTAHRSLSSPFPILYRFLTHLVFSLPFLFFPFQLSHSPLLTIVSVSSYKMHYALVSIIHYKYIMPTHLCSCKR